jgi:hypothetical protein
MASQYSYMIRIEGHLSGDWSDWFEGIIVQNDPDGLTTLCGTFVDQAALFGLLTKLHALNLPLISVHRLWADNDPDDR